MKVIARMEAAMIARYAQTSVILETCLIFFLQNAEVEGKVDTKQDHKRSDDALLQHRIALHTHPLFYRKSTVPAVPNVMQRVSNNGIFADQQQNDLNQRHTK